MRNAEIPVWRRVTYNNKLVKHDLAAKEIGQQENLYALKGVPASDVQIVEREVFREIDTKAVHVARRMTSKRGAPLSPEEKRAWAIFLNAFRWRHPSEIGKLQEDVAKCVDEVILADKPVACSDLDDDYVRRRRAALYALEPAYFLNLHKKLMVELIESESLVSALLTMHWNVLNVEVAPIQLLIGDRPFAQLNEDGEFPSCLSLPVGPRRLFVASDPLNAHRIASTSLNVLVRSVNSAIARNASEFVCGSASRSFIERLFCPNDATRQNR